MLGALLAASAVYAVVALGSDATGSQRSLVRSHPRITVVVSPSVQTVETRVVGRIDQKTFTRQPALVFGSANFRIRITNVNSVALAQVTVTDPRTRNCGRVIGTLAPGGSVDYACSAARVARNYRNVVSVSGEVAQAQRVLAGVRAVATTRATAKVIVKPKTKTKHHAFVVLPFTG